MNILEQLSTSPALCMHACSKLLSVAEFDRLGIKLNAFNHLEERREKLAEYAIQIGVNATLLRSSKQFVEYLGRQQIRIRSLVCDEYPFILRMTQSPPPLLYLKGNTDLLQESFWGVAIVGSRKASKRACRLTLNISSALSEQGLCIISGLAKGIDAAAHIGALIPPEGKTIAVLGSGFHHPYPRCNSDIYRKIIQQKGLLISQFEPSRPPRPYQFLKRNYLIAGLSQSGIVVRAARRSGALVTARALLEAGRDVYAVPGDPDDSLASGCNQLIKDGASPMTSAEDLLDELGTCSK